MCMIQVQGGWRKTIKLQNNSSFRCLRPWLIEFDNCFPCECQCPLPKISVLLEGFTVKIFWTNYVSNISYCKNLFVQLSFCDFKFGILTLKCDTEKNNFLAHSGWIMYSKRLPKLDSIVNGKFICSDLDGTCYGNQ